MEKINYVFDTNVLLYDPMSIFAFEGHTINIPITVIEEIDNFKKQMNQVGYNARYISRLLDELRLKGKISEGVEIDNGSIIRVNVCIPDLKNQISHDLIKDKADNLIFSVAKWLEQNEKKPVIFITQDANLRIKSDALGIVSQKYEKNHIEVDNYFEGTKVIQIDDILIDKIYAEKTIKIENHNCFANDYVKLESKENPKKSALVRFDEEKNHFVKLDEFKNGFWGIFARNTEQRFAFDALNNDKIKLVCLTGIAGTGKTLLAIAVGLQKTVDENIYKKMLVSRPIFPMGKDLGYLPGQIEEKLTPWMQPIFDNLRLIMDSAKNNYNHKTLIDQGLIEVEALTYIRGRSIPKQFFIVDEAQNLTPHEIKTILTRAGDETKIILTGDPNQIDNPYIDYHNNGLTYVIDRFKGDSIAASVNLLKGERSELATIAAKKL
jgi:PhoH-like ATPase